jgi:L-threonylcarbamoyladenylate synthase
MTKCKRIRFDRLDSALLQTIADALKNGAVIVYPTETIYGIGGIADVSGVREKIFSVKGRSPDNPMILVASDLKYFASSQVVFPLHAKQLAEKFWPGLLTLVLPCGDHPQMLGIRVSPHPFIRMLYSFIDKPIYSTSANLSSEPYANDPDVIAGLFAETADFFIDAGVLPASPPSTVVRVDKDNNVIVLREGTITAGQISSAII